MQQSHVIYNDFTVVIILNVLNRTVGMVVDGVSDVIELSGDDIRPAPEFGAVMNTNYIQGLGVVGERMIIMVDIEKLMSSDEMALMDAAVAANV